MGSSSISSVTLVGQSLEVILFNYKLFFLNQSAIEGVDFDVEADLFIEEINQ